MYSPLITKQTLDRLQSKLDFPLVRRSVAESEFYVDHFNSFLDRDTGELPVDFRFSQPETDYIRSERVLCKYDFRYWLERYVKIKSTLLSDTEFIVRPKMTVAWEMILDMWAEMEERGSAIMCQQLKARQLGACLDPKTRVLTANLKWIPIQDVTVGMELIAIDEGHTADDLKARHTAYMRNRRGGRKVTHSKNPDRKLRTATVVATRFVHEPAFRLTMDNGETLIATAEHKFLGKRPLVNEGRWKTVAEMQVGDEIRIVTKPWDSTPTYEDGWFGGMLDGEGSFRVRPIGGIEVTVSQVLGDVLNRARTYMESKGYTFHTDIDKRKAGDTSKLGNQIVVKLVLNRINEVFQLMGQTRPSRFTKHRWWEGLGMPGKKSGVAWKKILSIEPLKAQPMIDLQTTTGTFIAEGFVSHNSTLTELAIAHRVQFYSNVNALICSSTPQKTEKMSGWITLCYDLEPYWLMPLMKGPYESGEVLLEFPDLNSAITMQHGAKMTGIARGETPDICHLSEIPEWVGDPKELIDASLMPSIHPNPRTFVILESTAAGIHGWWHETWDISSEGYEKGTSTFRPIFLPWFIGTDVWPTQTWKNDHPIPADWTPTAKGSQHAERAKKYVATNALIKKFLGDDWEMPLDQTWFWECYRSEMVRKKALNLFLQEMPADPLEAFQTTNLTVFDVETIEMLNDQRSAPWGCFGIESNLLPRRLWPERRDWDLSRKPIELTWFTGEATLHFTLRPLTYDGYPSCPWENRVFIWEPPLKGAKYGVGVDTSYGLGQDRSTIEVVKEGSIINPAVQVAEFANAYVNSIDLTPICMCISAFYSSCYTDQMEQPLVAIECAGNGETTQLEMRKQGWSNFHRWERYDNMKRTRVHKLGWFTNSWSRPMLIDRTNQAIRDCNFKINSPWLIQELRTLSKDEFQQSIRADTGGHDDRYMGVGIAFFCLHVWKSVVQGDEDVFSSQAREQAKKQLEDWESRWKGGEHMFDFSLPTMQPVVEQQPSEEVYSGLVKTLDDDPLWGMSHE